MNNGLVLVVDDDVFFRESVVGFLRRHGYETLEAADVQTAYEMAAQKRPAVAIIDIVIPPTPHTPTQTRRNEGVELARRIKGLDPTTGIVLISAFANRGRPVLQMAVEGLRGLAYVVKGYRFGPTLLLQAIEAARAGHVMIAADELDEAAQLTERFWQRLTDEERQLVSRAVALFPTLSEREREVAHILAHSQTVEALANALNVAISTAEKHVNHIYSKLELDRANEFDPPLRKSLLLAKVCWLIELLRGDEE